MGESKGGREGGREGGKDSHTDKPSEQRRHIQQCKQKLLIECGNFLFFVLVRWIHERATALYDSHECGVERNGY